ncbi:MAG: PilZ domain-containing protein [Lachnospiraceae bacterium]|nr:PilZ domain-containing protein [Lachnospiraceae bacterium]
MDLSQVKIGSLLEIYIRRDGYNYRVISKVEYVDDERIGVSPIASRTQLFKFLDTDNVDIVCKQDNNSWKWGSVKPGLMTLEDGTKLHCFIPSKQAETFNRRTTFRLEIDKEIMISYEKPLFDEDISNGKNKPDDRVIDDMLDNISEKYCELNARAFLKDISEGGAAISTDAVLEKGDLISFEFELASEPVKCRAIVVRIKNSNGKDYFTNSYGISFVETSTNFVKNFFAQQRRSLQKSRFSFDK